MAVDTRSTCFGRCHAVTYFPEVDGTSATPHSPTHLFGITPFLRIGPHLQDVSLAVRSFQLHLWRIFDGKPSPAE
jgi:hypothetical protein